MSGCVCGGGLCLSASVCVSVPVAVAVRVRACLYVPVCVRTCLCVGDIAADARLAEPCSTAASLQTYLASVGRRSSSSLS